MLGGSTSIWGGRCVPLDPIDFQVRPHVQNSGWPFDFAEMALYYRRANAYCEAGDYSFDVNTALGAHSGPLIDGFSSDKLNLDAVERFSKPTDFAKAYGKQLMESTSIRVYLQSPCRHIELDEATGCVTRLHIGLENARGFFVKSP